MIPKKFDPRKASMVQLADLHTRLDIAIDAKDSLAKFNLLEPTAKRHRCLIKTEIGIRAAAGDTEAGAYLTKRRQLKEGTPLAMAAE